MNICRSRSVEVSLVLSVPGGCGPLPVSETWGKGDGLLLKVKANRKHRYIIVLNRGRRDRKTWNEGKKTEGPGNQHSPGLNM
jgi:hypothetical protein